MKSFLILFSVIFIFYGCVKNNPDPSWIEVTKWSLIANTQASYIQGELSQNITDAHVFIDNKMIGIFEVPFKIPILKNGNVNIKIYPVIRNNGISATKKIYPFLAFYEINSELIQNKTLTINPVTYYNDNTKFWIEDFEDATIKIENDPTSKVQIHTDSKSEILKYGHYYGSVSLTASDSIWIAYTTASLDLPKGGKEVYLEIDYYNSNNLITGLLDYTAGSWTNNTNIRLNKQDYATLQWKKIYIDLKELVSFKSKATAFKISFQALFESNGYLTNDIYLDNIKLVYN